MLTTAILIVTFSFPSGMNVTTKVENISFRQCAQLARHYMYKPNFKSVECVGENGNRIEYQAQ